jgi:hypothetical protein
LVTDLETNDTDQQIDQLIVDEHDQHPSSTFLIIPVRYCGIPIHFIWNWLLLILIGFTIGHSLSWFILVLIGLGIRVILSPIWTYNNRFRVTLGNSQPYSLHRKISIVLISIIFIRYFSH